MIIYGLKGVTSTANKGGFYCPTCNADAEYRLRRVRRFFTLYFIPLIPLNKVGEYVECDRCTNRYEASVLEYNPGEAAGQFRDLVYKTMLRTLSLVTIADGQIDDAEIEAIVTIFSGLTGIEIDELDVRRDIDEAQVQGDQLESFLTGIGPMLNDAGREMIIKACLCVATADGHFDDTEKAEVTRIAGYLGVSPAHMVGIIASLKEGEQG